MLKENLAKAEENIQAACDRAGRKLIRRKQIADAQNCLLLNDGVYGQP